MSAPPKPSLTYSNFKWIYNDNLDDVLGVNYGVFAAGDYMTIGPSGFKFDPEMVTEICCTNPSPVVLLEGVFDNFAYLDAYSEDAIAAWFADRPTLVNDPVVIEWERNGTITRRRTDASIIPTSTWFDQNLDRCQNAPLHCQAVTNGAHFCFTPLVDPELWRFASYRMAKDETLIFDRPKASRVFLAVGIEDMTINGTLVPEGEVIELTSKTATVTGGGTLVRLLYD